MIDDVRVNVVAVVVTVCLFVVLKFVVVIVVFSIHFCLFYT